MRFVVILALVAGCAVSPTSTTEYLGAMTRVSSFGSNPGQLAMYVYEPVGITGPAPLVVALHGCTQSAADYVAAGWNELADQGGFYVVYPEQQASNNQNKCFDWFVGDDIRRDSGEALSIKQMVDHAKAQYAIDDTRVFVTGLSAGGAMTAVMLATYPDVFAAGAVMAGLPYACATTQSDALTCMNQGKSSSPQQWGDLVRGADPQHSGPYPRVAVWQGSTDYVVRPTNADALVKQWTNVHGLTTTPTTSDTVDGATHKQYRDSGGVTRVESYLIPNMGHGTAIDPSRGCGKAGAYILDAGICSTHYAAQFFGLETQATTPPDEPPASACREFYASNYDHVIAGRAARCGSYATSVCATGSGQYVGLWNLVGSWLKETKPGYFEVGRCP